MELSSPAFINHQSIPLKYTCDGDDINPPLHIREVPIDSKSLVLIVDDPDAPAGTWVHWTLWNIDPNTKDILENNVPENAVEGVTSGGKPGYDGPCPPSGTHRYFFKLYALDGDLNLNSQTNAQQLQKSIESHILAKTELIGIYQRQ